MTASPDRFQVDERTAIAVPVNASVADLALARALRDELTDRYGLAVPIRRAASPQTAGRAIVMGTVSNPLVRAYAARKGIAVTPQSPGPSGYVFHADQDLVLVDGSDDTGAFYGMQTVRQLMRGTEGRVEVAGARIRDWPSKPFRGIKLYLPGRANIPFFKRFIRDFMALYKFNKVVVEMNACMRLDRHPELNAGWVDFARDTNYSRRN